MRLHGEASTALRPRPEHIHYCRGDLAKKSGNLPRRVVESARIEFIQASAMPVIACRQHHYLATKAKRYNGPLSNWRKTAMPIQTRRQ